MGCASSSEAISPDHQCSVSSGIKIPIRRKNSLLTDPPTYYDQLYELWRSKKHLSEEQIQAIMHLKAFQILNQVGLKIKNGESLNVMKQGCQRIFNLRSSFYNSPGYISPILGSTLCQGLVAATNDLLKLYPHQQGDMKEETLSLDIPDKSFDFFSQMEQANELSLYTYFTIIERIATDLFPKFQNDMKALFGDTVQCNNKLDRGRGNEGLQRVTEKYTEDKLMAQLEKETQSNKQQYMDVNSNSKSKAVQQILGSIRGKNLSQYPLNVYDIFRCKVLYNTMEELNTALTKLSKQYHLLRIKNKTGSSLSQALVNFQYELQIPKEKKSVYEIKTPKTILIAEVQLVIKRPGYDNPVRAFNHKLYEINRAGEGAVQMVAHLCS